eukprot:TRINITY_DN1598_c0_g1_i1.p3 TRINITY_DN1598_c0_g1~~TRINITY_DN1598_c0_g1_i1.p3  ORF type:complete len:182 (+),score=56.71 TRINITY_DN1598_c0_g1_i1:2-547(+)
MAVTNNSQRALKKPKKEAEKNVRAKKEKKEKNVRAKKEQKQDAAAFLRHPNCTYFATCTGNGGYRVRLRSSAGSDLWEIIAGSLMKPLSPSFNKKYPQGSPSSSIATQRHRIEQATHAAGRRVEVMVPHVIEYRKDRRVDELTPLRVGARIVMGTTGSKFNFSVERIDADGRVDETQMWTA